MAEIAEDADFYHEYNATLEVSYPSFHPSPFSPVLPSVYIQLFPLVLLQFDYYNSMMINTVDEDGNNVELGGEFPLEENEHFNKLPVSTQQSVIQVPTNVYNKGKTEMKRCILIPD